jgi:hypothetical protein
VDGGRLFIGQAAGDPPSMRAGLPTQGSSVGGRSREGRLLRDVGSDPDSLAGHRDRGRIWRCDLGDYFSNGHGSRGRHHRNVRLRPIVIEALYATVIARGKA